ncbi:shikimate kinase [Nannocystaceae bacterium ST9]
MRPIVLLGMMGAGKSSVGRALAVRRGAPFIDLDLRVERLFGTSIAALFEQGEPLFRARERMALTSLFAEPGFAGSGAVVAAGGGIVEDPRNLAAIRAIAIDVYLRVGVETLIERLSSASERARRPLLGHDTGDLELRLRELTSRREAAYASASVTIDGEGPMATVVEAINRAAGD